MFMTRKYASYASAMAREIRSAASTYSPLINFFFFNDTATTEIYTLSLHDALPISDVPYVHKNGRLVVETINGQDMMAWVTQGGVSDRTTERLGTSDKGVILYRNLLLEQMEKVERGEDPMGVVRDPAKNEPFIRIE